MERDIQRQSNEISGTVGAVLFRNEENGYTVLKLDCGQGREITAVGCMPGVAPGETLELQGSWKHHTSYGEQFKAEVVVRRMPVGAKAVFEYLASGVVKGVGTATARRLVDTFGEEVLTILEERPEELTRLRGITPKKAREMGESFRRQMGMRRLLEFLGEHSLPLQCAMPIYRRYGDLSREVLQDNPYLLVDPELGIQFPAADALALELGMEGDDPQRIEAGILFELTHNAGNGHTFIPREKLLAATGQLIGVEREGLEDGLEALEERGEVVEERVAGQDACYLAQLHYDESYVAMRLGEMSAQDLRPPRDLDRLLARIQKEQGIRYAGEQRQAVELAASRQVVLLTGGPGTGKTTSLRGVLALFDHLGLETALAAPTGRAAKRLGEACGAEAYTIHRLLETRMDPATGALVCTHNQSDPLEADAVIVDETSMVDISLMAALVAALRSDCRLVLVGDPDQLPSVGPGNLLSDLLRSGAIPAVSLTEIFRQARESAIVMNAHSVNHGQVPRLTNDSRDFFFLRRQDAQRTAETIVDLVCRRLPQGMGIPPDQIQVLSPTRRHTTGTAALNRALQSAVNPPAEGKGERTFGEYIFRAGDRVIQIRNNYDVLWENTDTGEAGMGIYNGDIGTVAEVDGPSGLVRVNFDGKIVDYTPDMLPELEPAYAITVHKAQGSEYRAVVLAACDGAPMLLTRGVLYTAITRARDLLVIVGREDVVAAMTANDRQTRRYSGLRARLAALRGE